MDFNSEMFDDMIDDEDSEEISDEEPEIPEKKRKLSQDKTENLKKVKYEDIRENVKAKKGKNDLYRPPTVQELNELKETENLFNNNLFRLQIKELVSEIEIKNKRKKFISKWFEDFKEAILNLREHKDILLSQTGKKKTLLHKLFTKYGQYLKCDQDLTLKFIKPDSVEAFGCFENNALPGPNLEYKINIKMPRICFHLKDFLNNRYLVKRYYYLLYIAEEIAATNIVANVSIIYDDNNYLLPILNVIPEGCDKVNVKIYISPVEDYFKPSRCHPELNNIKLNLFGKDEVKGLSDTPTLLYNCTLGHDFTLGLNCDFIKSTLNEQTNIQEGIKLLLVWMKQRELDIGFGVLTDNIIVYFIVYLTVKRKINKHMSSYQVIRNFWSFLVTNDLYKNPISICDNVSTEVLNNFKESFDIVLLDKSGSYNVLGFLNYECYKRVKNESELALKHLDDNRVNSFHSLFLSKLPFYLQYDVIVDIEKLPKPEEIPDEQRAKFIGYYPVLAVNYLIETLRKALNKRPLNIVPRLTDIQSDGSPKKIAFGINLDPDHAFNFIELGPALNDHVEAAKFRKFWGHLASDRRFRDGSARVAVYFKTRTIQEKRQIVKKIIQFVLGEKLKLDFKIYYDEFEEFIVNKKLATPYPLGTNEEASLKVINLSDDLGKKIRELKMSLAVTGVQGISDVYTYTEVFPPLATNYEVGEKIVTLKEKNIVFSENCKSKMVPKLVQVVDCVLQLEHSSKWPNNLEGVRHLKTSFYMEIAKLLETNHNLLTNVSRNYLEVFYEGLVFRYRIYLPKEISLTKKNEAENGITSYKESHESFKLNKELNILPKINAALKGLQSQHPSYGTGTALIKRWLRSQLIDEHHFPDIVINLLNASLYLTDTSFLQTNTPQMSFLRFLKFFSEAQWNLQSVLVNFNDEISKDDIIELESKLQENRSHHQPLYIITPQDNGQSIFTKKSPTQQVLNRVRDLALVTLEFYSKRILEGTNFEVKDLFIPNWSGYNLLIHLNPLANPRRHEQVNQPLKSRLMVEKYDPKKKSRIPIVNFNPIQLYLNELRENYNEFAMFFHDTYGGNTIGVLWSPIVSETKDFKVAHVNGRKLKDNKLEVNVDALIEDFYIIGKGLVKTIEKK